MEETRRAAFDAAQGRWPQVALDFARFSAHLDALGGGELPKHADSVFLCCACAAADPAACESLEAEFISKLRPAIAAVDRRDDFIAETLQRVREKLLSGPDAKIRSYSGRGPLLAWLGVVARRVALNQVRAPGMARERPLDLVDRLLEQVGLTSPAGQGVESHVVRAKYAPLFSEALANVLRGLPARERGMLRLQLVQGLNPDAIAVVYSVNRATVYRWLERCHERILSGVRGQLANELGAISTNEFQSLYRAVESQLRVSLADLLRSASDGSKVGDAPSKLSG
jgi:RNA polymerase sigma-70 factor, ECF subfamily